MRVHRHGSRKRRFRNLRVRQDLKFGGVTALIQIYLMSHGDLLVVAMREPGPESGFKKISF